MFVVIIVLIVTVLNLNHRVLVNTNNVKDSINEIFGNGNITIHRMASV